MAPLLGGAPEGAAFAGALVVYFAVLGFFGGWLYARLRLGVAMSNADALLELSRRASNAGDLATAEASKAAATAIISGVAATAQPTAAGGDISHLAAQYEELRATVPPSPRRTAQFTDLIVQARAAARSGNYPPQDVATLFQAGTEGRRVIALGLMEGDIRLADFPCVLAAIGDSRSAFEQFHGLSVANMLVPSLAESERQALSEELSKPNVTARWAGDTSRAKLSDQIRARLEAD
jgi:hypothetical protein